MRHGHALEIEVLDQRGKRPIRLRIEKKWLGFDNKLAAVPDPGAVEVVKWYEITLRIDCPTGKYRVAINGNWLKVEIPFADNVENAERLVFRTGPYRGYVPVDYVEGEYKAAGLDSEDLPGADVKSPLCLYHIDDVITR